MTADHNSNPSRKAYSFAPRPSEQQTSLNNIVARDKQRRNIRNGIFISIIALAGIIISLLLISPQEDIKLQVNADNQQQQNIGYNIALEDLVFKGITQNGNNFIVFAETAIEKPEQPQIVHLTQPRTRVDTESGNPITLRSLNGSFDQNTERVQLNGRVVIVRPDLGYTLMTEAATAHLDTGYLTSEHDIQGFSPQGQIKAQGIIISENARNITFKGKATLHLSPENAN